MSRSKGPLVIKKTSALIIFAGVVALSTLVPTNADAQVQVTPTTPTSPVVVTAMKGTIKVPAVAASGPFVGFGCANLVVRADSKAMTTAPPGATFFVPQPVWSRYHNATGTYASGACSYTLIVPASPHEFTMAVGVSFIPTAPQHCDIEDAPATGLGGYWTVPKGTTKTNNFVVTELRCQVIK
jgi:hypothetical protein